MGRKVTSWADVLSPDFKGKAAIQDNPTIGIIDVAMALEARGELDRAVAVLDGCRGILGFDALKPDANVVKISVIGIGMRSHAGVAKQMFRTLADKGINIQVISTSEIKVSVLIAAEYTELALRALHTAYGLDAPG